MNDLQALTQGILDKAQAEADAIKHETKAEVARISADSKVKVEAVETKVTEMYQRKIEDLERRSRIEVELESQKRILAAKHELVQKAFGQALEKLRALSGKEKMLFLAKKLADVGKEGGLVKGAGNSKEWEEILAEANKILANSGSKAKLVLANEQPQFSDGFVLEGSGYTVNGSYEAALEEFQSELIPQVADFLFADKKEG